MMNIMLLQATTLIIALQLFTTDAGVSRVSWKECRMDPGMRQDCGYYGITEELCYERECCWSETEVQGTPWCYHSTTTTSKRRCVASDTERIECGSNGIRKEQCLAQNCCWQPSGQSEIPWCYHEVHLPLQTGECGNPVIRPNVASNSRIVGGVEAKPHSWPWQVSLQSGGHFCGASVINDRWVISAAHCWQPPSEFVVVTGAHDKTEIDESMVQVLEVEEAIQHEMYGLNGTMSYDLMLIKTKTPIEFNDHVIPVCLPEQGQEFEPGTRCYVTGWGTLTLGGERPLKLQQVMLPILEQEICQEWYTDAKNFYGMENMTMPIVDTMICAGYEEGGRSGCHGDSGGPFVCYGNDAWTQVGAVSWGGSCGYEEVASVFARISELVDWMDGIINEYA